MNNFTGRLRVDYIDGKHWYIVHGFTYRVGDANGAAFIKIPSGFVTDFASFPFGIFLKSPGGKWDKPAVVHDLLYRRGWIEVDRHRRPLTRAEVDAIFNEAMAVADVDDFRRAVIYAGVRAGGWRTWNRYRKADANVETAR